MCLKICTYSALRIRNLSSAIIPATQDARNGMLETYATCYSNRLQKLNPKHRLRGDLEQPYSEGGSYNVTG